MPFFSDGLLFQLMTSGIVYGDLHFRLQIVTLISLYFLAQQ